MAHGFPNQVPHLTWCEVHEKKAFTKVNAKRLINRLPGAKGMRRYECGHIFAGWHVGHLPELVRRGDATSAEVYGTAA